MAERVQCDHCTAWFPPEDTAPYFHGSAHQYPSVIGKATYCLWCYEELDPQRYDEKMKLRRRRERQLARLTAKQPVTTDYRDGVEPPEPNRG